jgi:hypothetical protein
VLTGPLGGSVWSCSSPVQTYEILAYTTILSVLHVLIVMWNYIFIYCSKCIKVSYTGNSIAYSSSVMSVSHCLTRFVHNNCQEAIRTWRTINKGSSTLVQFKTYGNPHTGREGSRKLRRPDLTTIGTWVRLFLISNFRRVLNVVWFLLGCSPASVI